jgi:MSHA pilin protein MshC
MVAAQRGFTLIELIMVIVILGVLAVFAAPRIFNTGDFDARGFHDETMAYLRYAQKTAIAQRRTVCVELNPTGVSMTMDTDTPPDAVCNTTPAVTLPNAPHVGTGLAATTGTSASSCVTPATISSFRYTPLGSPATVGSATELPCNVEITITNSTAITVEANTGYVHD